MKILIIFLVLTLSFFASAKDLSVNDTISNWQVYLNGSLFQSFNINSGVKKIILTKGKIKRLDTLTIVYSDCTLCVDCYSLLELQLKDNTIIKSIKPDKHVKYYTILTTELQVLAFRNKSSRVYFSHKMIENDKKYTTFLFEIEIK